MILYRTNERRDGGRERWTEFCTFICIMLLYTIMYVVNTVRAKSGLFVVTSSYYRVSALCFYASFIYIIWIQCTYMYTHTTAVHYISYVYIAGLITYYYIRVVNRLFCSHQYIVCNAYVYTGCV